MKARFITLGGLIAVLAGTAAYGVFAQQDPTAQQPPAAGQGRQVTVNPPDARAQARRARARERHPELRRAMIALTRAHGFLQHAAHDFGGHRAKAEQLTAQAIGELRQAMRYDKR